MSISYHECSGEGHEKEVDYFNGRWCLNVNDEYGVDITFCPFCGERLVDRSRDRHARYVHRRIGPVRMTPLQKMGRHYARVLNRAFAPLAEYCRQIIKDLGLDE